MKKKLVMIRIRLKRIGRKRVSAFRIHVVDSHKPRDTGASLEDLGFYQPQSEAYLSINLESFKEWISKGATASDRVLKLVEIASNNKSYVRVKS